MECNGVRCRELPLHVFRKEQLQRHDRSDPAAERACPQSLPQGQVDHRHHAVVLAEREVLEADRTGLENVSLHETAHEIGVIGKAMSYESKHVMLTEEQLRASGNSTCVPGEYRVFRAELVDCPKKGRLLLEPCE